MALSAFTSPEGSQRHYNDNYDDDDDDDENDVDSNRRSSGRKRFRRSDGEGRDGTLAHRSSGESRNNGSTSIDDRRHRHQDRRHRKSRRGRSNERSRSSSCSDSDDISEDGSRVSKRRRGGERRHQKRRRPSERRDRNGSRSPSLCGKRRNRSRSLSSSTTSDHGDERIGRDRRRDRRSRSRERQRTRRTSTSDSKERLESNRHYYHGRCGAENGHNYDYYSGNNRNPDRYSYRNVDDRQRYPYKDESRYQTATTSNVYKVYVGNLSFKTTWQNLKDHMKRAGAVYHAEIMYKNSPDSFGNNVSDKHNAKLSKGCGVVEYYCERDTQDAMRELDGTVLDGREIYIRPYDGSHIDRDCRAKTHEYYGVSRSQDRSNESNDRSLSRPNHNGFSHYPNVNNYCDDRSSRGNGRTIDIKHRSMDESKKFRSSPDSRRNDRSTQSLSRSNLSSISQQAKVNDDGPDDDTIDNHRLFVGNLTHNTTDQDLGSLFERAGRRIVRADIIRSKGRSRKSKGCGVIEYENAADAQHALIKLSGAVLNGRVVNVQKARKYDSSAAKHGRKDHHNDDEETTIQQCNKVRDLPEKQDRKTGLGNLDPLLFDITQSEEKKSDDFDESLDKFGEDDDEKYSGPRMK